MVRDDSGKVSCVVGVGVEMLGDTVQLSAGGRPGGQPVNS